ncbi:MAG: TetR/AcrR family transcriptional regulator [Pseudomonadota bacterium]
MRDRNAPGRPREFDDTEMLRKIMALFWRSGFDGVSLSHIMSETKLQKASLYAAFGDKRSMYLKALQQYYQDVVAAAARALRDGTVPPHARIEAFLTAPQKAVEADDRTGCFLCNASADQADLNTETQAQVKQGFETLADALMSALTDLNPGLEKADCAAQAQLLLALYSGFRIIARSGADTQHMQGTVAHVMTSIRP